MKFLLAIPLIQLPSPTYPSLQKVQLHIKGYIIWLHAAPFLYTYHGHDAMMPLNTQQDHVMEGVHLQVAGSIQSVSLGLDLTLRALQSRLKADGHPWEVRHSCGTSVTNIILAVDQLRTQTLTRHEFGCELYIGTCNHCPKNTGHIREDQRSAPWYCWRDWDCRISISLLWLKVQVLDIMSVCIDLSSFIFDLKACTFADGKVLSRERSHCPLDSHWGIWGLLRPGVWVLARRQAQAEGAGQRDEDEPRRGYWVHRVLLSPVRRGCCHDWNTSRCWGNRAWGIRGAQMGRPTRLPSAVLGLASSMTLSQLYLFILSSDHIAKACWFRGWIAVLRHVVGSGSHFLL